MRSYLVGLEPKVLDWTLIVAPSSCTAIVTALVFKSLFPYNEYKNFVISYFVCTRVKEGKIQHQKLIAAHLLLKQLEANSHIRYCTCCSYPPDIRT